MRTVRDGPPDHQDDPLLTTGEVAARFGVDQKTVNRWVKTGRMASIKTPGGHFRVRQSVVDMWLAGGPGDSDARPEGEA